MYITFLIKLSINQEKVVLFRSCLERHERHEECILLTRMLFVTLTIKRQPDIYNAVVQNQSDARRHRLGQAYFSSFLNCITKISQIIHEMRTPVQCSTPKTLQASSVVTSGTLVNQLYQDIQKIYRKYKNKYTKNLTGYTSELVQQLY